LASTSTSPTPSTERTETVPVPLAGARDEHDGRRESEECEMDRLALHASQYAASKPTDPWAGAS